LVNVVLCAALVLYGFLAYGLFKEAYDELSSSLL
jgi:hypothetical protein